MVSRALLALAICLAAATGAWAQGSSLNREPYTRWNTHTGPPEEAVVHVRVTLRDAETGESEVREGSGFVVRCDGFVLVPSALFVPAITTKDGQTRRIPRETIQITLRFAGADGPIPAPQIVNHPRFWLQSEPVGLAQLKVNDLHFKGIPLLHPRNIRPNRAVEVVWAAPSQFRPGEAVARRIAATVGVGDAGGTWFAFAGDDPRVPPGALVIDAESRLAIGIVPGTAREGAPAEPALGFLSFANFHQVSNAVGLLPDPKAREAPDRPHTGNEDMVWVPGGPVILADQWAKDYVSLYGKWVVCTPGFWIDRREVTNAEYLQFLQETRYPRLPMGWRDLSQSAWWRESPVLGVSTADAEAYAAWRGKRLVTPAEWSRAEAGGDARFAEYLAALNEATALLATRLIESHLDEDNMIRLKRIEAEAQMQSLAAGRWGRAGARLGVRGTFVINSPEVEKIRADRQELIEGFNATMLYPREVVPAGWREADESVFGVRDVAMNVYELLQPNFAQRQIEVTLKQLPKLIAPGFRQGYTTGTGQGGVSVVFVYPGSPPMAPIYDPRDPPGRPKYLVKVRDQRGMIWTNGQYAAPTQLPDGTRWFPDFRVGLPANKNGFRCAR